MQNFTKNVPKMPTILSPLPHVYSSFSKLVLDVWEFDSFLFFLLLLLLLCAYYHSHQLLWNCYQNTPSTELDHRSLHLDPAADGWSSWSKEVLLPSPTHTGLRGINVAQLLPSLGSFSGTDLQSNEPPTRRGEAKEREGVESRAYSSLACDQPTCLDIPWLHRTAVEKCS